MVHRAPARPASSAVAPNAGLELHAGPCAWSGQGWGEQWAAQGALGSALGGGGLLEVMGVLLAHGAEGTEGALQRAMAARSGEGGGSGKEGLEQLRGQGLG